MKQSYPPQNKFAENDWQALGGLDLPGRSDANSTIGMWLSETLSPLELQTDFLNKILKSAQDAVARALQTETVVKIEQLHVLVYTQPVHATKAQNWGFFRIEKVSIPTEESKTYDHSIEFYLYLER